MENDGPDVIVYRYSSAKCTCFDPLMADEPCWVLLAADDGGHPAVFWVYLWLAPSMC